MEFKKPKLLHSLTSRPYSEDVRKVSNEHQAKSHLLKEN